MAGKVSVKHLAAALLVAFLAYLPKAQAADASAEAALLMMQIPGPSSGVTNVPATILQNPDLLANGLVPSDGTLNAEIQAGKAAEGVNATPSGGGSTITTLFVWTQASLAALTPAIPTPPQWPEWFLADGTNFNLNGTKMFARSLTISDATAIGIGFNQHNQFSCTIMMYSTVPHPTLSDGSHDWLTFYATTNATQDWTVINQSLQISTGQDNFDLHNQVQGQGSTKAIATIMTSNTWYAGSIYGDVTVGTTWLTIWDSSFNSLGTVSAPVSTNLSQWNSSLLNNLIYSGEGTGGTNYVPAFPIAFDAKAKFPLGPLARDFGPITASAPQTGLSVVTPTCTDPWAQYFWWESQTNGGTWGYVPGAKGMTTRGFTDSSVADGSTYNYRVTGSNAQGMVNGPTAVGSAVTVNNKPFFHPAIASISTNSASQRNDATIDVGCLFTVNTTLTVSQLALHNLTVQANIHSARLYLLTGGVPLSGTATGTLVGHHDFDIGTAAGDVYGNIVEGTLTLMAGNSYFLMATQMSGSADKWLDDVAGITPTYPGSDITIVGSAYLFPSADNGGTLFAEHTAGNFAYACPNFLCHQ